MLAVLLLVACSDKTELVWLEGSRFGWAHFNHRLAHWETRLGPDGVDVAVIGGTSTTGVAPELPAGCIADACVELPSTDDAEILVRWARAETTHWQSVVASTSLVAGPEGDTKTITVDLPKKGRSVVPFIQGFSIDGGEPLTGGLACYSPENGWLPKEIKISLGAIELSDDGMKASIDVTAAASAGESLEDARQCMDDVNDQARFRFDVDVLIVEGTSDASVVYVSEAATYEYGTQAQPLEQPQPEPKDLQADLGHFLTGWASLDWKFHVDDPDGRGAYLRTLGFEIVADGSSASGIASSYSPATQLSGFDYTFNGIVGIVNLGTEVTRGTISETIAATVDDDGAAVLQHFPLE